jgi:signal transduction histidine kinase/CheY-like chemotaxis protein
MTVENRMSPSNDPAQDERVLILTSPEADHAAVTSVLDQAGLSYRVCADIEDLCRELTAGAGTALLAQEVLDQQGMSRLTEVLQGQPPWSDFPLVVLFDNTVTTTEAGLRMLDMLGPLGNLTLLERPVRVMTLVSAIRAALRNRRHQYGVRDLLARRDRDLKHRDEFLTMLAHELRTPLSSVLHATQILDRLGPRSPVEEEQHAIILRQSASLARLVDDVLDVNQLASGTLKLHREPTDLIELAGRCLREMDALFNVKRQRLSLSGLSEPLVVMGDPHRLKQVLIHLLRNAMQYTPAGGKIELILGRDGDAAEVRVRDTGAGLTQEQLARLFAMSQAEEGLLTHRPEGGLKIGLTLVSRLVELQGGTVLAASEGPGQGSEFVVRLPLAKASEAGLVAPRSLPEPVSRRILLVEDNPDGRETLRLLLQVWGHRVDVAEDGKQGLQKALSRRPEVALVDIGLPEMDGYEMAQQVRAALGQQIFLIAITGYGQPHDRWRAMEAGFDVHLVKPFDPDMLQELLLHPEAAAQRDTY